MESANQVNDWVSNKTHSKIPFILPKNYNINDVSIILVNAIYFKGSWEHKFAQNTIKREFKNFNNKKIVVDTMYNSLSDILYYEDEKIQMISLPYISSSYEMIIILPRDNKYSSSYDYLNNENVNITKLISKLKYIGEVELYLPKFEFEYENGLNEILIEMGMKKAFSEGEANFSKINNEQKLFIGDVLHKTFIKVDQNGTEAAAATAVIQLVTSAGPEQQIERYYMYVNHSFIFLITDNNIKDSDYNNLILFLGTVNNLDTSESQDNLVLNIEKGNNENNDNNENNNNGNNNVINNNESKDKNENENEKNLKDITVNISENEENGLYKIKVYSLLFLIILL